jgi:colanic acid/amylovoran biosynthesis glycosyltransferase
MVDLEKPAYRAATLWMFAAVRLVLARSESLRQALVSLGCPEEKLRLQRTGIPLSEIAFRPRTFPQNGQWHLLQAGRLIEKKGFRTSLRAFAGFARRYPAANFTIAGEGALLPELKNLAQELGLGDRVTFAGFLSQPDLRAQFYRAHLFLHPSETGSDGNQEGVPNSMLEAMASGLPVFATNHGGIPEAIDHRSSGILVAERDADALARELIAGAENPEFLNALAQRGATAVAEKFEQSAQVRRLEDYYFDALR